MFGGSLWDLCEGFLLALCSLLLLLVNHCRSYINDSLHVRGCTLCVWFGMILKVYVYGFSLWSSIHRVSVSDIHFVYFSGLQIGVYASGLL